MTTQDTTTPVQLPIGTYRADSDHSTFSAGARHFGVGSFRTTFADFAATLVVDDGGPRLEGRAQVESIDIHNPPKFREQMLSEDFFHAAEHPEVSFTSSRLELSADGTLELEGELVIRGIASPLRGTGQWRGPVEDPYGLKRIGLDLEAVIDRRDWGMAWQAHLPKGGEEAVGFEITVDARLELIEEAG
jgi:polyisoprenoid-binding protein YceI